MWEHHLMLRNLGSPSLSNCRLIAGAAKFRMEDVVSRMEDVVDFHVEGFVNDSDAKSHIAKIANQKFINFYNGLNSKT
jgi:hypothetical protein